MILYDLACAADHRFEAWFRNGEVYDRQVAAGDVHCPFCGSVEVRKAPMAPSLVKGSRSIPEEIKAALTALKRHVEANFEDVGADFAEEARRIHYGETEDRSIYGEASPDEAAALADEGIPVAPIPWIKTGKN